MKSLRLLSVLALTTLVTACGGVAPEAGPAPGAAASSKAAAAVTPAPLEGWFIAVQDYRRCPSPRCGGFWLYYLNREKMTCADGTTAERCYVARIDWRGLGFSAAEVARLNRLAGQTRLIMPGITGKSPERRDMGLGILVPYAAFEAATARAPEGIFARFWSTKIVCVRAPCFNIAAEALNWDIGGMLSGLDLKKAGATAAQEAAARKAMATGDLLAAGEVREVTVPGAPDKGLTFFATQFYTRVKPKPAYVCKADSDCTASAYYKPVRSRADCYCPLCPTHAMTVAEAKANRAAWNTYCKGFGPCPVPACIKPPPVTCLRGKCVFKRTPPAP